MTKNKELNNEKLNNIVGGNEEGKRKSYSYGKCPWCDGCIPKDIWPSHVNGKEHAALGPSECSKRPADAKHVEFDDCKI